MSKKGEYIPAAKTLADAGFVFGGGRGGGKTEALRQAMIKRTIAFPDTTVLQADLDGYRIEKPIKKDDITDLFEAQEKQ